MRKLIIVLLSIPVFLQSSAQVLHHQLNTKIQIESHELTVTDHITLPVPFINEQKEIIFSLNKNLVVKSPDKDVTLVEIKNEQAAKSNQISKTYKVNIPKKKKNQVEFTLSYTGKIYDKIESGPTEYARGFSETTGIIFEDGVYLAGSTHWFPEFRDADLFSFVIDAYIDKGWLLVSQGKRTIKEEKKGLQHIVYEARDPMDEAYLVGGKWTEYDLPSDHVLFQAFLRTPDEKLANKYLKATRDYLAMDEKMIGPYPFTKFALVENFWETGYGMPSFTLLGPRVIRFPWILYSSYPHELLHNYWGNSVYVDYKTGNWCEGITVYMADHLMQEQQGKGAEYRRNTLQKYTDFVTPQNDFPVAQFHNRNNPAQEAVGYGKCMMMNNMLRDKFGDQAFLAAYRKFYQDYRFKIAGFGDIRKCFEEVTGQDLQPFFRQWIQRTGAPKLELSDVQATPEAKGYRFSFQLNQTQQEEVFDLDIPVAIYPEGEAQVKIQKVHLDSRSHTYRFLLKNRPLRIEIDPAFQIFRRLDRKEVPTSLTQLFGATKAMIVLPSNSPYLEDYRQMAQTWKASQEAQHKSLQVVLDDSLKELPGGINIWILGNENKFASQYMLSENYIQTMTEEDQSKFNILKETGSVVYTLPNPSDENHTIGFISSVNREAISGLGRKLPHYGKYSYLGFEGTEPSNVLKGIFPAMCSPLNYSIPYQEKTFPVKAKITPRKALSEINE